MTAGSGKHPQGTTKVNGFIIKKEHSCQSRKPNFSNVSVTRGHLSQSPQRSPRRTFLPFSLCPPRALREKRVFLLSLKDYARQDTLFRHFSSWSTLVRSPVSSTGQAPQVRDDKTAFSETERVKKLVPENGRLYRSPGADLSWKKLSCACTWNVIKYYRVAQNECRY